MDNWDLLTDSLKEFHITLTNEQFHQFQNYYELMIEWNSFMNLTAITEMGEVIMKHFVDSVSLIQAVPDLAHKEYSLIDVGTGAGFPGIPLKIVFPDLKITLLDSLNKRVKFLNQVILDLSLENILAVHGRAEDLAQQKEYRELNRKQQGQHIDKCSMKGQECSHDSCNHADHCNKPIFHPRRIHFVLMIDQPHKNTNHCTDYKGNGHGRFIHNKNIRNGQKPHKGKARQYPQKTFHCTMICMNFLLM